MEKATRKFRGVVQVLATSRGYDLVTEKGNLRKNGSTPYPDLTKLAIRQVKAG